MVKGWIDVFSLTFTTVRKLNANMTLAFMQFEFVFGKRLINYNFLNLWHLFLAPLLKRTTYKETWIQVDRIFKTIVTQFPTLLNFVELQRFVHYTSWEII